MYVCLGAQSSPTLCDPLDWTVARQASLSMRFFRQEHWSGSPFPLPEDLPNPGIKPVSPVLQADSLLSEPPGKAHGFVMVVKCNNIYKALGANTQ